MGNGGVLDEAGIASRFGWVPIPGSGFGFQDSDQLI